MHKNLRKKLLNRLNCHFTPVKAIHLRTTRLASFELNLYFSADTEVKNYKKSFKYQRDKIWNSVS